MPDKVENNDNPHVLRQFTFHPDAFTATRSLVKENEASWSLQDETGSAWFLNATQNGKRIQVGLGPYLPNLKSPKAAGSAFGILWIDTTPIISMIYSSEDPLILENVLRDMALRMAEKPCDFAHGDADLLNDVGCDLAVYLGKNLKIESATPDHTSWVLRYTPGLTNLLNCEEKFVRHLLDWFQPCGWRYKNAGAEGRTLFSYPRDVIGHPFYYSSSRQQISAHEAIATLKKLRKFLIRIAPDLNLSDQDIQEALTQLAELRKAIIDENKQ